MLYLFDLDGTLITSYMDNADRAYHRWEPLPGRAERLGRLRGQGHSVGVVTNQAGVAFGYITEADWVRKRARVMGEFGLRAGEITVCFDHPDGTVTSYTRPTECARRKPFGAMIVELMINFNAAQDETLYVGDMDSDRQAAAAAGVEYMDAAEFFSRSMA